MYRITTKMDYVIGIDPDCDKSGIAFINVHKREVCLSTKTFADTLDYLRYIKQQADTRQAKMIVVIEAGWQAHTHWHLKRTDSQQKCAALGNAVGRNHETGRKLCEMCKHWQIPYREQHPLVKRWGKTCKEKISHEELTNIVAPQYGLKGIKSRTNPEERDATLIALTEVY